MTRRALFLRVFACMAALAGAAVALHAAAVNGRLVHANGSAASGITVTLSNERGRSAPVQSDGSGAYTLPNIPAGQYNLEVWVNPRSPQTEQVTITEPATSVPRVTVP
jgi:hypothetical protein